MAETKCSECGEKLFFSDDRFKIVQGKPKKVLFPSKKDKLLCSSCKDKYMKKTAKTKQEDICNVCGKPSKSPICSSCTSKFKKNLEMDENLGEQSDSIQYIKVANPIMLGMQIGIGIFIVLPLLILALFIVLNMLGVSLTYLLFS